MSLFNIAFFRHSFFASGKRENKRENGLEISRKHKVKGPKYMPVNIKYMTKYHL